MPLMDAGPFKLEQIDADEWLWSDGSGINQVMSTADAVELFVAAEKGIGGYVDEMRAAKTMFDRGRTSGDIEQERADFGDFDSPDPVERYEAHQRAKGSL